MKKDYENLQNDHQRENALIFYQILSYYFWGNVWRLAVINFVTNSYSESWDLSCENSRVLVKNHWVPVQKLESLGFYVTTQYSKDSLQNSVLQFTEMKIYSFCCKPQQWLKEMCSVKQQPQEQPHKSHKQNILQKHLQIDQSITKNYFLSSGIFIRQGRRTQR